MRTPNIKSFAGLRCSVISFLLLASCALCGEPLARAQLLGGSVLVATYSKNEIAMAADSRLINTRTGQFRDDYCKISAPENKILFGETGVVKSEGNFNSSALIRRLAAAGNNQGSAQFVRDLATQWANAMAENFTKLPPDRLREAATRLHGNNALDCALFAGANSSGNLAFVRVQLFYRAGASQQRPMIQPVVTRILIPAPASGFHGNIAGCGDINIKQFSPPSSAQSKAEVERWRNLTGDVQAQIAIQLVQLAIQRAKPLHFASGEVVPVGGPIDAAEILKAGGIKWIQRKPACPAN